MNFLERGAGKTGLNYSQQARPLIQSRMCHQGEDVRASRPPVDAL